MLTKIRRANVEDLARCVEIENSLSVDSPEAAKIGFLRGGATEEAYYSFLDEFFLVAEIDGIIVGFLIILSPQHPRLVQLKDSPDSFKIEGIKLNDIPELMWLAKVAVVPERNRQGIAKRLWEKFNSENLKVSIATTTAYLPVSNIPSRKFHEAIGFRRIGTYHASDGTTVHDLLLLTIEA